MRTGATTTVRVRIGAIPLAFLNTEGRRRAVPLHDLHHVLTGYATHLVGEAEIGAWEVASGCGRHWAAWHLNLLVTGFVLVFAPGALFRAFVRGRHTRNLYRNQYDDSLLDRPLNATRRELGLQAATTGPELADRFAFIGWAGVAVALVWGPIAHLVIGWQLLN